MGDSEKVIRDFSEHMTGEQRSNLEFRKTWYEWILDRLDPARKGGRNPVTERAAKLQLKKLAGMSSCEEAIASLNQSIERGWTGLWKVHGDYHRKTEIDHNAGF